MAKARFLTRVRAGLADLIRPKDEGASAEAPPAPPAPPRNSPAAAPAPAAAAAAAPPGKPEGPAADFEERLRRLLASSNKPQLAGAIHLVGLSKVRERFGPAWQQIAERADLIARKAIERRLAEGDFYCATSDINYLIVFPGLTERMAQIKCRLIGEEIAKALLGSEGADGLEVKTAVFDVDGNLSFAELSSVELELAPIDEPPPMLVDEAPRPVVRPRRLDEDVLAGISFLFSPMWRPSRSLISNYLCRALVPTSDVGSAVGNAELAVVGDETATQRLDEMMLRRAIEEVRLLLRDGRKLLITVPLHFETVGATARRRAICTLLGELPEEGRRLVVVEITHVPEGAPQSRLFDIVAPLRSLCNSVVLLTSVLQVDLSAAKDTGAAAIGADITAYAAQELLIMQHMNRFFLAASRAGLTAYIRGVRSRSLAAAAVGAGFFYIEGEAIGAPIAHPKEIRQFGFTDMFGAAPAA